MSQNWDGFIVSLYKKMYDKLFRVANRLMRNEEAAKDLVQDVFLLAMGRQKTVHAHPDPEAWLMVVLINLVKNEKRRHHNHDISLEEIYKIPLPEQSSGIDELLPSKLTDEERQILVWHFAELIDYKEMSKRLGISEVGCRSRVSRIVAKCRRLLDAD